MWLAIYDEINSVDTSKSKRTDDTEIFKILPQDDFNFILNSKTEHRNARLFKVHMVFTLNYKYSAFKYCRVLKMPFP